MEPDESRDRLMRAAKRKELVDGARRSRINIPIGIAVVLAGAAIAYYAVQSSMFGPALNVFFAAFGLILVPLGVAIIARAITTIGIAHRRVRELDALALPAARIVRH